MSEIVEWRPPSPPDWRKLSEWLLKTGPQPLAKILATVRVESPEATSEYVAQKLAEKKGLFRRTSPGTWAGVQEQRRIVVYPRARVPRPRPQASPRRAPQAAAPHHVPKPPPEPPRHQPASRSPFHLRDGELVSVIISKDAPAEGTPYESGGRILLPVPQDIEASEGMTAAIMLTASESAEVEVFAPAPDGSLVFRGTRRLLQAARNPVTNRVDLVFERAEDDEGRYRIAAARPLLLPTGTRALATATADLAATLRLTDSQRKLAALPLVRTTANRKSIYDRAQPLLREAGITAHGWQVFAGWLAETKPKLDQETLESLLRMALNTAGLPKLQVLQLAAVLLQEADPASAAFARDCAIALCGYEDPAIRPWTGRVLAVAVRGAPDDPTLKLAQASFAAAGHNDAEACALFAEAFADPTLDPDAASFIEYLLLARMSGSAPTQVLALDRLDTVLARLTVDQDFYLFRECLQEAVATEAALGRKENEHERLAQVLRVLLLFDEGAAWREWETACAGEFFKVSEKLDLLSILEDCESADGVLNLAVHLQTVAAATLGQKNAALQEQALQQLLVVESILGDDDHRDSSAFERDLATHHVRFARQRGSPGAPGKADPPDPVKGLTITLVAGHHRTRSRVKAILEQRGADVREVAPSSESHLDERKVKDRTAAADIVVAITDFTGHDATAILRNLKNAGASFRLVMTRLGPSRILADIDAALASSGPAR